MSQTFDTDNDPMFYVVVEAIKRIVTSIEYGIQFEEGSIQIEEPDGCHLTLNRVQWKRELQVALDFFEKHEYYEDCAHCADLISKLDAEPTIEQIIRQLSNNGQSKNED